jgi:hypothetical protein
MINVVGNCCVGKILWRKQCMLPMEQNEIIEEQKKFPENQLS